MNTASIRQTIGAILSTVTTTANAVTSTLNTVEVGITMLDRYTKTASDHQRKTINAQNVTFDEQLAISTAQEITLMQQDVLEFCKQSPDHSKMFQTNYDRVMAAISAA